MKSKLKIQYLCLNTFAPLLIGGSIYVLYRTKSLLMFHYFKDLGIESLIDFLRLFSKNYKLCFPNWVIYSLPNALWLYSFYSFWFILWKKEEKFFLFLLISTFSVSLLSEFLQYLYIINGSFSWMDVFFIFLSLIIFTIFHFKFFKHLLNEKIS